MSKSTCTTKIGCATEASDGQGAVTNMAMGTASASARRTGMLQKVTTRRVKLKGPACWIQKEDDDAQVEPKRARVISKDPFSAKHKWSITAASTKEVQKMGTGMNRGGGPSTSHAAAIQTEEVPMAALKKKLDSMSTSGKKEHLAALQAQVERHDNRIKMLRNLLTMEEKERKEKFEQMKSMRDHFGRLSTVPKSLDDHRRSAMS